MNLSLVLIMPDGSQRSVPVKQPRSVIGRNPDCAIRIPVGEVSRQHCEIASDNTTAIIRDLGSSNGTFVNRAAIAEHKLSAGDVIVVGPATFVVQVDGSPAVVDSRTVLASAKAGAAPAKPAPAPKAPAKPAPANAGGGAPVKPQPKPAAPQTKGKSADSSFGLPPLSGDPGDSSVVDFDFNDDEKDMPKL